jgi:hypothetical protein
MEVTHSGVILLDWDDWSDGEPQIERSFISDRVAVLGGAAITNLGRLNVSHTASFTRVKWFENDDEARTFEREHTVSLSDAPADCLIEWVLTGLADTLVGAVISGYRAHVENNIFFANYTLQGVDWLTLCAHRHRLKPPSGVCHSGIIAVTLQVKNSCGRTYDLHRSLVIVGDSHATHQRLKIALSIAALIVLSAGAALAQTGSINVDENHNGHKIFGLPTPTAGNEAATKAYADSVGGGGGGGSGTVTSITATAPIVVTPSPITATGVISITAGAFGNVYNTGTPVNNRIAIWTDATHIEGDGNLTYDASTLIFGAPIVDAQTGFRINGGVGSEILR